jgi:hypothetical protein
VRLPHRVRRCIYSTPRFVTYLHHRRHVLEAQVCVCQCVSLSPESATMFDLVSP